MYRLATFDGSDPTTRLANEPERSKQTTGIHFKNNQENIHLKEYHPDTGNDYGRGYTIHLHTDHSNAVFNRLNKTFPEYNYISISKTIKD